MRRAFLLTALIMLAVLLCACYPGDIYYYESRFDELDINGRVSETALKIEDGRITPHLKKELEVIADDLQNINTHKNPYVKNVNSDFISAVNMLSVAAQKRESGDDSYSTYIEMAKKAYNTANATLNQYKVSLEAADDGK